MLQTACLQQAAPIYGITPAQLLELRLTVERQMRESQELLAELRNDLVGGEVKIRTHHHEPDYGTTLHDLCVTDTNASRILNHLTHLTVTREKLERGTFTGVCTQCKNLIPWERLLIVPHTTLCTECKEKQS